MKKTTDFAPWKTDSSSGQPPATKTGSTPGTSLRHWTSSFVPALNSWAPGGWLGVPAIRTILASAALAAEGAAATRPPRARPESTNRPDSVFMRQSSGAFGREVPRPGRRACEEEPAPVAGVRVPRKGEIDRGGQISLVWPGTGT